MKQVLQSPKSGAVVVAEVPVPVAQPGEILVRVAASLISAGTERLAIDFASKNLLQKAQARPDLVRQVLDKARRDGVLSAIDAVRSRLDAPTALGYSNAGTVIAVGDGVTRFRPGDRVACAGAFRAVHAEVVAVPVNLVVPLADNVDFESAAFSTLGAIAQHGIRLSEIALGEVAAVIGLGLLGQLTVQLLSAAGCKVLGLDLSPARAGLARQLGAYQTTNDAAEFSATVKRHAAGRGADVVFVTAHSEENAAIELAADLARDRGTVLVLGSVPMDIPRKPFYDKELKLRVSRSYGPGRYDPEYEEKGRDYPAGYVRWTENRNLEAFADLVAAGRLNVQALITHRFDIADATRAYDLIAGKTGEPYLGVVLTYPQRASFVPSVRVNEVASRRNEVRIGMIGAGNFARAVLLPAIKAHSAATLIGVCTASSASAKHVAEKFGFGYCTCSPDELIADARIDTVVITTPHYLHASQVVAALCANKNVFCEKPLCLNQQELAEIAREYSDVGREARLLMVGYNRRFAPMVRELKNFFAAADEPLAMQYRINAGQIPLQHSLQDPERGGGRIVGEVCHFLDLLAYVASAPPTRIQAAATPNGERYRDDNLVATVEFANGSVASLTYAAGGDKSYAKERLEVYGGGRIAVLDDYRLLDLVYRSRRRTIRSRLRQDKGHAAGWQSFESSIREGKAAAIPFEEIVASSLASFCLQEAVHSGKAVEVDVREFLHSQASLADPVVEGR